MTGMQWRGSFDFDAAQFAIAAGVEAGVRAVAADIFEESQALVPNDPETGTGDLKSSGQVDDVSGATRAAAEISYGTDHAVYQHERLDFDHDGGEAAKYLERPLSAAQRTAGHTIAAHVRRALS